MCDGVLCSTVARFNLDSINKDHNFTHHICLDVSKWRKVSGEVIA